MRNPTAYDLKSFYNNVTGSILKGHIADRILELWCPEKKLSYVGLGYALPYLQAYQEESERCFSIMPAALGVHHWPNNKNNLTCLVDDSALPLETNSIDRMIVAHHLEFLESPEEAFAEMYRVLKSTGKLIIIVPNRLGLWARADWSPLGQGQPYSARQVEQFLRDTQFVHERTCQAVFTPAYRNSLWLRASPLFERVGKYLYPALGGVHIIEASKQLYAMKGKGLGSPVTSTQRVKKALSPKPVPNAIDVKPKTF
ncbi:MAG: class I SAM-dependent methyltransferase [Pseudomonadota bacterium]